MLAGPTATQAQIDMIEQELGLDQPLLTQFWIFLGNVAEGNLGDSWISSRPVLDDVIARAPITLELLFWGIGIGALVGIPIGMRAAARPDGWFDNIAPRRVAHRLLGADLLARPRPPCSSSSTSSDGRRPGSAASA